MAPASSVFRSRMLLQLLLLFAAATSALALPIRPTNASADSLPDAETLLLVVGYCPTAYTSAGAIVSVNPSTGGEGEAVVVGKFAWPSEIFGCLFNYDPTVAIDLSSQLALFDFTSDTGYLVELNIKEKKVTGTATPSDPFFTGFENMVYVHTGLFNSEVLGVSATVEEQGFCSDGCFAFGKMAVRGGKYVKLKDIPFKALLDDSHFYDATAEHFWIQGSYDLREDGQRCAPNDEDECMLQIDAKTGDLLSARGPTNFTVYKYFGTPNADGAVLGWVNDPRCKHPYNDFGFAQVDLAGAKADIVSCISHNVTVHMDEWISSFSADGRKFATGSGNTEAPAQVLVFDVQSGRTLLNTNLTGLGQTLGAYQGLFAVWGLTFDTL